ncbi:hypothetical protein AXF42_Ash006715 [Apostasia shenzhenica]|uniref:C3HC-type domain-containing protein n=1 Tax=Apostasia shenzhenica TaxID=1088818 RepID=A0A2I0AIX9_9ASPA|nr:hypothetical protein AXF42_Ash006715 [Apostasia shenzhenica]
MAEDSEKRLKMVMDKLRHVPKDKPLSRTEAEGGTARKGTVAGALSPAGLMVKAPLCRPWDRGDFMRRLATFKAMTWFGKPKVIGPINCARRGWINVEMDVIVCEACGARLLFSTPPSWAPQQVESAAEIFCLKLNNGHKILCPWNDNACDESLAQFPPTPPEELVERFKERSFALLRLSALPVISSVAMDYLKCPQLEHFLSMPSHSSIALGNGIRLLDGCRSKDLGDATEDTAANAYNQAHMIINLCGWEPRLLPYTVDFEDLSDSPQKIAYTVSSELDSSCGQNDVAGSNGDNLCDPASTVLDCRFCGACVGLWSFKLVNRPLEFFKLIIDNTSSQNEEISGTKDLVQGLGISKADNSGNGDLCDSKGRAFGLHLTIAGGPPPTKQYFRPKVSFPVISRHIRADFASSSGFRYDQCSLVRSEAAVGSLKHRRTEVGISDSKSPNDDIEETNLLAMISTSSCGDTPEKDHPLNHFDFESSVSNVSANTTCETIDKNPCLQNEGNQYSSRSTKKPSYSVIGDENVDLSGYASQMQVILSEKGEFDPIRQHRPFCSWIASDESKSLPGWKMTLLALNNLEKISSQQPENADVALISLLEADDPIASVRKLFMSPPAKRLKSSH